MLVDGEKEVGCEKKDSIWGETASQLCHRLPRVLHMLNCVQQQGCPNASITKSKLSQILQLIDANTLTDICAGKIEASKERANRGQMSLRRCAGSAEFDNRLGR